MTCIQEGSSNLARNLDPDHDQQRKQRLLHLAMYNKEPETDQVQQDVRLAAYMHNDLHLNLALVHSLPTACLCTAEISGAKNVLWNKALMLRMSQMAGLHR